ncbi:hypothetical protein BCR41DRAFT_367329 [Lobosporangium transversale]|uniref:Pentacotripeptide-repeat region of PRORP domain-containing protein n=1 Tax=Lobosporangium transversale TaxID=64571 RepID=A0A1Y2GZL1_9FUNG|nr:hypothetical protein BCR41DRAFT_367329 [Lobosporangium transversale]ORZ27747.1 hypothetical protein BCR41DRAFT_367329 [Lobosporangium transversale]|eukprot:XP_021885450.1 hypothetical protein BCR41DRAFT_367329 [Lobosporangium transversale]
MTAVDRIWGIWQDFLLTGMKPDVVLYTALMDALLNAKDFERADQIWNHMHQVHQKNQDHEHHPNYNADRLKPIPQRQQQNHQEKCPNVVTPNTQTLSVLMQAHVLKRDPEGVAQIYKEIIRSSTAATASTDMDAIIASKDPLSAQRDDECQQHHLSRQTLPAEGLARHTNTVLLNQILKVLVDYGEASAAKEIYAEMRLSPSGSHSPSAQRVSITDNNYSDESGADNNDNGKYTHTTQNPSSVPSASALPFFRPALPLHHQTFMRRSNWIHQIHRQSGIRPDKATHNLMLQLARRTGDHELEKVVLQNMQSSE